VPALKAKQKDAKNMQLSVWPSVDAGKNDSGTHPLRRSTLCAQCLQAALSIKANLAQ